MVRWLFNYGENELATGEQIKDGLAEALNHVVGRVKTFETSEDGLAPKLDTPELLKRADCEMYVHVHPAAAVYRVTSDGWAGEIVFMASPRRQRAIAALEQATALLIRCGPDPGATVRACRLLEVVRTPVLALVELPSMGITLSWCVENLAGLVNGASGYGEKVMFYRILRELEGLQTALVRLTALPETTAFVIPSGEDPQSLLRDFCSETLHGVERARHVLSTSPADSTETLFGSMHTLQVTSGFFSLDQLQRLARSTERLIGSVRECGANMTEQQLDGVRHSVHLVEVWVVALVEGLDGDGTVASSPELEAHIRMLEHVLECGGDIVVYSGETVVPVGSPEVGPSLCLDEAQLARLESLRAEVREWAELARSEGPDRSLAEPGEFFERAHQELVSICQSVRRVPLAPVLASLARHCREASARFGKLVRVDIEGDTLDAQEHLMASMAPPLVHLVNNAVEHGIEDSAERARLGKPILALVQVRAERTHNSLVLEVTDDGRGVPPEIVGRADREGVEADRLEGSLGEVHRLHRSNDSGAAHEAQGCSGMDVVVREVEAAGGIVELEWAQGEGTRIRIVLPEPDEAAEEVDEDEFADLAAEGELTFL